MLQKTNILTSRQKQEIKTEEPLTGITAELLCGVAQYICREYKSYINTNI